ncbi:MAG: mannan-binding protein [Gammaproteobacteria bacterium]|nr:mannan-binding protein [Gammaproteobacteria bacterium]
MQLKIILFVVIMSLMQKLSLASESADCPIDAQWLFNPALPDDVKNDLYPDKTFDFCGFYQFSTQAFLYLMSPSDDNNHRNFLSDRLYPLLESYTDGSPADSCNNYSDGISIRTSLNKNDLSIKQAGHGSTIYAQDGNVIYYNVRFGKSLCNLTAKAEEMKQQKINNFPPGSIELKMAWKKLSSDEQSSRRFITQEHFIEGEIVQLGLVGFHIAIATKDHPEFIWSSYEHRSNSPNCSANNEANEWTFANAECTQKLPESAEINNNCSFNQPSNHSSLTTGSPTNICRVFVSGTGVGDFRDKVNIAIIDQQNKELFQLLSSPDVDPRMKPLMNYFNVGAIWVGKISNNSSVQNQRGSLRLASSVSEADFQNIDITKKGFVSNCFGCHNFNGTHEVISNNISSHNLSHIFKEIKVGQGEDIDITAKTAIHSDLEAKSICKMTCKSKANYLAWNGDWNSSNSTAGSVCGCTLMKIN